MEYEKGSPGSSICANFSWYALSQVPTGALSIGALPMKRMLVHGATALSVRWTKSVVPIPPTTNPVMMSARTQVFLATMDTAPENAEPPKAIRRQNPIL